MCPKFSVGKLWKRGIQHVRKTLFLSTDNRQSADRELFKSQATKFHLSQQSENGKAVQIQMGSIFMAMLKMQERTAQRVHGSYIRLYLKNLRGSIALVFALGYATNHDRLQNMAIIAGE